MKSFLLLGLVVALAAVTQGQVYDPNAPTRTDVLNFYVKERINRSLMVRTGFWTVISDVNAQEIRFGIQKMKSQCLTQPAHDVHIRMLNETLLYYQRHCLSLLEAYRRDARYIMEWDGVSTAAPTEVDKSREHHFGEIHIGSLESDEGACPDCEHTSVWFDSSQSASYGDDYVPNQYLPVLVDADFNPTSAVNYSLRKNKILRLTGLTTKFKTCHDRYLADARYFITRIAAMYDLDVKHYITYATRL